MPLIAARKSGIRNRRRREAKRLLRDRKIYAFLRVLKQRSVDWHRLLREPIEPLSVWVGKATHSQGHKLTKFPVRFQPNGKPMPEWKDLSTWFKLQLTVWVMDQWEFQTFNIHLHPRLDMTWSADGRDKRMAIRDRLRRELDAKVRPGLEHFFVIEGWSKLTKTETIIHIHGAAAIYEDGDADKIMDAAARAMGHRIARAPKMARATHGRLFTREGPAYINYLFKSVRRQDDRLPSRRVTQSRSTVGATREFWKMITAR